MKIKAFVLLLFLVLSLGAASGQPPVSANAVPGLQLRNDTARLAPVFYLLPSLSVMPGTRPAGPFYEEAGMKAPAMPAAYSYEKLGAFCKIEVQLEKAARMPVKFRLGEVQYVERLEGKLPDY